MAEKVRTLFFFDSYFNEFFVRQRQKVKDKIIWTLRLIETQHQIPVEYLKHLEGCDGLYEIRIQHGSDIFRVFCVFDEGKIIVLLNGFQKKSQKTPRNEIDLALKIKQEYENSKRS
ncbi:MAG: addiction module toxin RelE [Bacteroidetes bacterium B1(2017)]|nr:MAG: addiction module toxin RelE [Bacteroidetes bacterium B1(2017)]